MIAQEKLRVAFLTPSLHIGGAERWILSLAKHFAEVTPAGVVLCAPHFHHAVLTQAARLMPVYVARKLGDAEETRRLLARACVDADVLIAWGVPRLARVTHDLPLPVIDVSHSDGAWQQHARMVQRAASGADFHVAVSRCALAAFPPEVRSHATVIYNGAEADRVAPRRPASAQRRDWGLGDGQRVALFLGRFDPVKAPLRLVSAVEHLPPHWHAVFHGHGPQRQELLAAAARAGQRAHVLPPLTHVGDALAAADVLVMPSQFEGMPLALVEAWLAGLPTVTTPLGFVQEAERRHGPLVEIVPHEPTGQQLAQGILRAAQRMLVEPARRIAWQNYTAAAMAQRWEEYLVAAVSAWNSFNRAPTGSASERHDARNPSFAPSASHALPAGARLNERLAQR